MLIALNMCHFSFSEDLPLIRYFHICNRAQETISKVPLKKKREKKEYENFPLFNVMGPRWISSVLPFIVIWGT